MSIFTFDSLVVTHIFLLFNRVELGCCSHAKFSSIVKLTLFFSNYICNKVHSFPIDTNFSLPSQLPSWPTGGGFATGEIDLGGLQLRQITTFTKIWTGTGSGPDGLGATFLEPSPIPEGFSMLGSYAQPNNRPLSGWILVGKTNATDKSGEILKQPTDYSLIQPNENSSPFFWLPIPPDGYKAVGLVVTASPEKPSLDKIRCVRSDFTADAVIDDSIWISQGVSVYGLRPRSREMNGVAVSVGTFVIIQSNENPNTSTLPLSCLINKNAEYSTGRLNSMQREALIRTYAPYVYFHPDEEHLPSSVEWFFSNGALLYKKGEEGNPVRIDPSGANLPLGGSEEGSYWLDLPAENQAKDMVKKGDLATAKAYIHFKPILGGTFTDIQLWLFYPFNGHATAKVGFLKRVSLGKVGEHVGDWEHVTMRVSNFDGVLYKVYFSQHSGGEWVEASLLEYDGGGNRFAVYASRNGHANKHKEGVVLQGPGGDVGIRNDWERSERVMDVGGRFEVVAAEGVVEAAWLEYMYKWGPTEEYDTAEEVRRVRRWLLVGKLKRALDNLVKVLDEIFGKDGPTGPKAKHNWFGDEL